MDKIVYKAMAGLIAASCATLLLGCVSTPDEASFGIQPQHRGYIPARIAILPCQTWPNGARFANLPLSNVQAELWVELCATFDAAIIEAFTGQPYMRGHSPKSVKKHLAAASLLNHLQKPATLWRHLGTDCQTCETAPGFYVASLAKRPNWLAWLAELSRGVRNADAVLMPFFTYAFERRLNDRGLVVARRDAGVSLLLIDTGTGELIWAGGRGASVPRKRLEKQDVSEPLEFAQWDEVLDGLFVEPLWVDFPGRQVF